MIARLQIRRDRMAEMLRHVATLAGVSRSESGCLGYAYLTSPEEPDLLVFVERWVDDESFHRHRSAPHFAMYRHATAEHVVSRAVTVFDAAERVR